MRVLVDTNVILDVLLDRKPFAESGKAVFALAEQSVIEGYICATTVTTVDYLLRQTLPSSAARNAIKRLLELFEVAPVNRPVLEQALLSGMADFEDAVLEQSGRLIHVDLIITRDVKHFRHSKLCVLDPDALISTIDAATEEE